MTFRERTPAPGQKGLCACSVLATLCHSHGYLHGAIHDEVMRQIARAAVHGHRTALSSSAILLVLLALCPPFSGARMASYYILRGIHYPNQQLLKSKQPVNLGWPWRLPPVLGNTVIWAEGRTLGSAHWAELLRLVCPSCKGTWWALPIAGQLG